MTLSVDTRGVTSDRVDQDPRRWPVALATLLVGLILGALIGGLYAAGRPASYTATTAISVLPDPAVDLTSQDADNNIPTQDATAFIQSQLVVINGRQLADEVRDQASLGSAPSITATQVGQTYVVQVSSTAGSRAIAARVAQLAGSTYATLRAHQLTTEVTAFVSSTNQQLNAVRTSLGSARTTTSTALTPAQTALQTEYERLLSVRSSLAAAQSQASRLVTVVSPARASDDALSTSVRDALGGALVGAILALLLLVVVRRTKPRVRSAGDLVALDVAVILPVQPRRSVAAMRRATFASGESRLLAARLHAGPTEHERPLVVIGTGPGVGASLVATSVAESLAGRGPVLLVRQIAEQPSPPAPTRVIETRTAADADQDHGQDQVGEHADDQVAEHADDAFDGTVTGGEEHPVGDAEGAADDVPAERASSSSYDQTRYWADGSADFLDLSSAFSNGALAGSAGTSASEPGSGTSSTDDHGSGTSTVADGVAEVELSRAETHPADEPAGPQVTASSVPGVWVLDVPVSVAGDPARRPAHELSHLVGVAHRAGWLVVVDAEPVSQSDIASDCARDGAALALVAGRGRSSPAEVLAAVELFDAERSIVLGVVLNDVPGPLRRWAGSRIFPALESAPNSTAADVAMPPWLSEHRAGRPATTRPDHRPRPSVSGGRHQSRHTMLSSKR